MLLKSKTNWVILFLFASLLVFSICFSLLWITIFLQKIICIDPGHQIRSNFEREPIGPGSLYTSERAKKGTKGVISGVPEYQITLAISFKLKSLLEKKGFKVIMTREKNEVDISNAERAEIANRAKADLFLRIHTDGSPDPDVNGVSVFYPKRNQWTEDIYIESKDAAQFILNELVESTGAKKNEIMPRGDLVGFNWSKVTVIVVEAGFLTNPGEDELLNTDDYQWKVAQGICNGVSRFLLNKSLLRYFINEFAFNCADKA